jgi:NDP-sugar pyrophosphorylase family protein
MLEYASRMKAIILAAGKGSRMRHLTRATPKPLLMVGKKTILGHLIDSMPKAVNELIIVIGYQGEKIKKSIGTTYKGRKVHYVVQKKLDGTAHAILLARPFFGDKDDRFHIANRDQVPNKK